MHETHFLQVGVFDNRRLRLLELYVVRASSFCFIELHLHNLVVAPHLQPSLLLSSNCVSEERYFVLPVALVGEHVLSLRLSDSLVKPDSHVLLVHDLTLGNFILLLQVRVLHHAHRSESLHVKLLLSHVILVDLLGLQLLC